VKIFDIGRDDAKHKNHRLLLKQKKTRMLSHIHPWLSSPFGHSPNGDKRAGFRRNLRLVQFNLESGQVTPTQPFRPDMKILALETSSLTGTVAVLEDGRLLGERPFSPDQRTAQSFAPAIQAQLEAVDWSTQDVQLVAVTNGPGSFTGLRVGVTAAKTFAYAVGAELVAVNTLQTIAHQAPPDIADLWAVLNAQRKELFVARFQRAEDGTRRETASTRIVKGADWLEALSEPVAVTGTGLKPLLTKLPERVTVIDQSLWTPQASTVGQLGFHQYAQGQRDDLWKLVPLYLRKSAAEEKWDQKTGEAGAESTANER
jgi:tRNA threonylcarbamoyladenosine biosynthesis protein TsaB